jgi:type I restriction enzyme R subunit
LKEGEAPKTREIYFSIYQSLYSEHEAKKLYQEYPPDFFDLIIIDECHRSGFGTWHEILKYFSSAVHLGMTATPKRDDNIDTYAYFGKPVYLYSMGQGIEDGFLAPFHIYRVFTTVDKEGLHLKDALYQGAQIYIPEEADLKEFYTLEDFEREIVLPDRTRHICHHLTNLLRSFGPMQKTMVFCVSMEHAAQVTKELQNRFSDLGYPDYSVRIVSEEPEVKAIYERFRDSDKPVPVIATTVDLLTTGVDVPSVQNIVLVKPIASKVVFKQIVGRGCRIDPDTNKYFFRIIDYVNATRLLDDWDYPPVIEPPPLAKGPFDLKISGLVIDAQTRSPIPEAAIIAQIGPNIQRSARTDPEGRFCLTGLPHSPITLYLRGKGFRSKQLTITPLPDMPILVIELKPESPITRKILLKGIEVEIAEETRIVFTADGKSLSEAEYIEYSRAGVIKRAASLDQLREIWIDPEKRSLFLKALEEQSIFPNLLASILKHPDADPFDLLAHIAFDVPIISRDERARAFLNRQQQILSSFGPSAREVLLCLLDKYRVGGIGEVRPEIFRVPPFDRMGYAPGIIRRFGGAKRLDYAMKELQERIYAEVG